MSLNRAIVGELSLPMVLRRIVEAARDLVGARYGALGVIGPTVPAWSSSSTSGWIEATVAAIGDLPEGEGPARRAHRRPTPDPVAQHRRRRAVVGLADRVILPMEGFLGVPIRSANEVFGNLYLTGHRRRRIHAPRTRNWCSALAATAGIAIENAHLYEEARRRQHWLQASAQLAADLLSPQTDRPAAGDRGQGQDTRGRRHGRADRLQDR